jgi:NAD+ kinase
LHKLCDWLGQRDHAAIVLADDQVHPKGARIVPASEFGEQIDLCVLLGGDGTMLRASLLVADHRIPVLGINLGRLGFMVPFDPGDAVSALESALAGKLDTEERMRLSVTYRPASGESVSRSALNDVVIHQGAMARLIEVDAHLDSDFIASYRADGLVVATPTGSTAYNLAAGGPIVFPGHKAIAITPICAHALTNRPLVVPSDRAVRLQLTGDSMGVVLTIDGQWAHSFQPTEQVEITASESPLVVFTSSSGYFDILREKLHWGVRVR